jgi:hypothetical protein
VQGFDIGVPLDTGHQGGEPPGRSSEEREQRLSLGSYARVEHRVAFLGEGTGC